MVAAKRAAAKMTNQKEARNAKKAMEKAEKELKKAEEDKAGARLWSIRFVTILTASCF